MKKDKNIQKELEELSPKLSKISKNNLDIVPYNYFESLPNRIFSEIRKNKSKNKTWMDWLSIIFQPKLVPAYVIAGILVLGVIWVFNQNSNSFSLDNEMTQLNEEDISGYVLANLDDFNNEWLEINYTPSETDKLLFIDSEIDEIGDYLLEEMSDLEYDGIVL